MTIPTGYLVLQQETARLSLDPKHGGVIREFSWRGQDILRPAPAAGGEDPVETACFPMVPYANRIAGGRFSFGGRDLQLTRNWSEDPHPLHGDGWHAPWSVVEASGCQARIRLEGGGGEWPWRYCCDQFFKVSSDALMIELSIENLSDRPMPTILGLHPYFPDVTNATLQAQLPRVWSTDSASLPVLDIRTPPAWSFATARAVGAVSLDHCFSSWDGLATLRWPNHTVAMHATNCSCVHMYTPAGRDFFCIEPQTAAAGALGRQGEATVVAAGERFAMQLQLSMRAN